MVARVLGIAALLLAVSGPSQAQTKVTVVADEWPPFSGSQLPNGGISLDVISSVLERAGYAVSTQILPWARIMDGAKRGAHDIVGSLFVDEALKAFLTYSDAYYHTEVKFVRRKGTDYVFDDLDGLRPYSIAVGDGFLYEEAFDRADYLNKVVVTTTLQGVRMVAHGRADLTLDSVEVIDHAIENEDPSVAPMVEFLPKVLATHGVHMAVRNGHPRRDEIVEAFDRVLGEMRASGELARLLEKHATR